MRTRTSGDMVVRYDCVNPFDKELFNSVRIAPLLVLIVISVAFPSDRMTSASVIPNILPVTDERAEGANREGRWGPATQCVGRRPFD